MNIQAEKLHVLQQIINSNDISLINDLKAVLNNHDVDWFESLSKVQQNDVLEGIIQLDRGESVSHDAVKKKFGVK